MENRFRFAIKLLLIKHCTSDIQHVCRTLVVLSWANQVFIRLLLSLYLFTYCLFFRCMGGGRHRRVAANNYPRNAPAKARPQPKPQQRPQQPTRRSNLCDCFNRKPRAHDREYTLLHNLNHAKRNCVLHITKTYVYNFDPLKPHFYIVKLGFTGVYIIFLISAQKT